MNIEVNWFAVLLAGASSMLVGSIWYAKGVFGDAWAKLAKVDLDRKMKKNEMVYLLGTTFLVSLVTAFVLAHVIYLSNHYFGNSWLRDSLQTGLWVWVGFIAVRFITHDMFEGRRKKLTLLTIGNEFITIMMMALVIGLLKP